MLGLDRHSMKYYFSAWLLLIYSQIDIQNSLMKVKLVIKPWIGASELLALKDLLLSKEELLDNYFYYIMLIMSLEFDRSSDFLFLLNSASEI